MQQNLRHLLDEIQELEAQVANQLKARERKFFYSVLRRKVSFDAATHAGHLAKRQTTLQFLSRASFMSLLTSPVIYAFILPALFLDACTAVYQRVIFPVYGIPLVQRSDYITLDRGQLPYLNWLERINCDYCSYVNGLMAYVREVAARTEQYFCPIRHAIKTLGLHPGHRYYLPYGDASDYHAKLEEIRMKFQDDPKVR